MVERREYAQYRNAVLARFRAPRQRNWRGSSQNPKPSLVVLDGWGHFDPQDDAFELISEDSNCVVKHSRHLSFSDEWRTDFDAALASYIEKVGATVLRDYRGESPY